MTEGMTKLIIEKNTFLEILERTKKNVAEHNRELAPLFFIIFFLKHVKK